MADFTDIDVGEIDVATQVRMVFRIAAFSSLGLRVIVDERNSAGEV